MTEKIAKIKSTYLGYEDHGIFTAYLDLDYGGSGQGAGGYCLDEPVDIEGTGRKRRIGTGKGMDFIIGVLRACGVRSWEEVAGKTVIAICEPEWGGRVIGIKNLPTEQGGTFMFADAFPREEAAA